MGQQGQWGLQAVCSGPECVSCWLTCSRRVSALFSGPHQGDGWYDTLDHYTDVLSPGRPQDLDGVPRVQVPGWRDKVLLAIVRGTGSWPRQQPSLSVYCLCLGVCPLLPSFWLLHSEPDNPWAVAGATGRESFPSLLCVFAW